jgi:hypothetical protein
MSEAPSTPTSSNLGQSIPRSRGGLQFRLWHILALTLIVSVACAIIGLPDALAGGAIGVTTVQLLVVLIVSTIYAHGSTRAFCIGALVPICLVTVVVVMMFNSLTWGRGDSGYQDPLYPLKQMANGLRVAAITGYSMSIVAGVLAILVRWYFVHSRSDG